MRVLVLLLAPVDLRNYGSVIRLLGQRGHEVRLAFHGDRHAPGTRELLDALLAEVPGVTATAVPAPDPDAWLDFAADVRSCLDYLQFLDPAYHAIYRERAERRLPEMTRKLARYRLVRSRPGQAAAAAILRTIDRSLEPNPQIVRFIAGENPDVVLFSPYISLRTPQPDYLRAARALGLPTGVLVQSWDNLTSKSLMRPQPDRVFVWNEMQRREAEELHQVPRERVVVTGAQCYDQWFEWRPRPWEEFCERVGLDPSRPLLLWLCFVPFKAAKEAPEIEYVRRWVALLRASGDPTLEGASVLVRPHPKRLDQWRETDLSDLDGVVAWPLHGRLPTDPESQADYYDSIYHSRAAVGLNTSAMIEAAVVGRPVFTIIAPEYHESQQGTVHFRHLLEVSGDALVVAHSLEEHVRQLSETLAGHRDAAAAARRFVEDFVRPHGLDVPATPIFVDAIEELAARGRRRREHAPLALRALRPLLAPLARRSAGPALATR